MDQSEKIMDEVGVKTNAEQIVRVPWKSKSQHEPILTRVPHVNITYVM